MPVTGTFYTSQELKRILGVSKSRVSELSRKNKWASPVPGLYDAQDVSEYLWARWRKDLAREFGEPVKELVRHDEWDREDNCPACGAFAIWKPATLEEKKNLSKNVYSDGWRWKCIKGHSSEG